jgi:hypothetical protein
VQTTLYILLGSQLNKQGWLSRICRKLARYGGGRKQAIARQVKIYALEQMFEIENAMATSFEGLDLRIEPFHKAAVFSRNKKVGDLLPPVLKQTDEVIETK